MTKQIIVALFWMASAAPLLALDGYVGVYAEAPNTVSRENSNVALGPRAHLTFNIALVNEEDGEELLAAGGLGQTLAVTLRDDEAPIPADELHISWRDEVERYAFYGGLPPEPREKHLLEPGVGWRSELTIRRIDGLPFRGGDYTLYVEVKDDSLLGADGLPWRGRRGAATLSLKLDEAKGPEDQLWKAKMLGIEALAGGTYERALDHFQHALDLDPSDDFAWSGLGRAYFELQLYREAAASLDGVVQRSVARGMDTTLPALLVESYVALGEREKAAEILALMVPPARIEPLLGKMEERHAKRRPTP